MASAATVAPSATASQKSSANANPTALDRASAQYRGRAIALSPSQGALKAIKRQIVPVDAFGNRKPRLRGWLHVVLCGIDYSNIFLIIAGTNTPVLFALSPAIRRPYLTVIWVTAAIGTILHIVWLRTPNWVFTTVYVVLGLAPVTLIPQLWTAPAVGPAATILIACGGAAYIAGAVCFALRKPNPIPGWFEFHEVFHLGTVIGYACHVVAIYLIACAL